MTLQVGDVLLIRMRFHHGSGNKVRPVLVILDSGDQDFVAAPITSQARLSHYDLPLVDRRGAGLNLASFARVQKLTVLPKNDVIRSLGALSGPDGESLNAMLCRAFCQKPMV